MLVNQQLTTHQKLDISAKLRYNTRIKQLIQVQIMSFSKDQLALQAHIEAENAAFEARCKADGATWWSQTVTDPAHWAGYGITTIAQYEHHMIAAEHYDYYKDVHGIRPRWIDYSQLTVEQIAAEIDSLSEQWQGEQEWIEHCNKLDAEQEAFEAKFADPEPSKYDLLAEQAGY